MSHLGIREILAAGGVVLLLLICLSVYSLALIWERWRFFKRTTKGTDGFLEKLRVYLAKGDMPEAMALCKQSHNPAAEVLMASFVGPTNKDERMRSAERALQRHSARLQRGLGTLGTIGSTAPFIGLFGTVMGVMRAFRDLAGGAGAGPGVVANGIAEALITTAAGLFVAIPAIIGYNYFTARAAQFSDEVHWLIEEVLERLTERALR
ncbi:MAG: MotA/TolQ/ExbB proton channel family protein [Elusimicrobia bacterium]|nr:MotA/TolQ/ExbB proton channel family protein [Elusimicrobiota bacterium]